MFQNFTLNYGVKRIDLGGKALTNYLKELVSYRALNVMDETFIMDDVKEKLCFVSLNVPRDLQIARFVSVSMAGVWSFLMISWMNSDGFVLSSLVFCYV